MRKWLKLTLQTVVNVCKSFELFSLPHTDAQIHLPSQALSKRDKRESRDSYVVDGLWGRNKSSLKTTGECIIRSDCIDTVAMQMVHVETGGRERLGQRKKRQENKDTCFGQMHRHKTQCLVNTEE